MRLSILIPVLLAASLTAACGQPAPGNSGEAGQAAVKTEACGDDCTDCSLGLDTEVTGGADVAADTAAEAGPPAELMTVRLAIMGMG